MLIANPYRLAPLTLFQLKVGVRLLTAEPGSLVFPGDVMVGGPTAAPGVVK